MSLQVLKTPDLKTTDYGELLDKPAEDIAEIIKDFNPKERVLFLNRLDKERFADIFYYCASDVKESILLTLTDPQMVELLDELASDELVDTLQEMPANVVTGLLHKIDPEKRKITNRLLKYPEESVGSLMSVDYCKVQANASRSEILQKIKAGNYDPEHLLEIYIVEHDRSLIGLISLGDLVQDDAEDVENLIRTDIVTVQAREDQEVAANLFGKYHRMVLPVVDSENRMIGIITADDIFQVIEDELYEDFSLSQGVSSTDEQDYLDTPVKSFYKSRIVWLLILMISATLTGLVISHFESVLASNVILAAFIPMLMDSSGNAGSQASTTVIRAVSLDEVKPKNFLGVLWKEIRIGLSCGVTLAVVNFLRMYFLTSAGLTVSIAVSVTLIGSIMIAKIIGGMLPLFATKIGQDPAVMAGPLLTTIADTITLLLFFFIAKNLLGL